MNYSAWHKRTVQFWSHKSNVLNVVISYAYFFIACGVYHFAGLYAASKMSNTVSDLFLDLIPPINTSLIFNEGAILLWIFCGAVVFYQWKRLPFMVKSLATLIVVRSFAISLTHLGAVPGHLEVPNAVMSTITFRGGDLFFSGHTAYPFLMSLVCWNNTKLRWIFLISSIIFGIAAIVGHQHYSIDVFGAFFVAYGVFRICQKLFPRDYKMSLDVDALSRV
jgi:membrane-associated phospholipid phosphatase